MSKNENDHQQQQYNNNANNHQLLWSIEFRSKLNKKKTFSLVQSNRTTTGRTNVTSKQCESNVIIK
ncbi:hypothetical protein DERP_005095 [Dermatophagoides pteronyssinus]|uniref:Uncharacterized protein n=1 Tax=Dermatophagoides pteronyssinus TaxID=6956 RepID=A0ABQ8JUA6_DERPT|nr:hypothetical protein DERP_005095 [Dermatophagoides pteronyssinus]